MCLEEGAGTAKGPEEDACSTCSTAKKEASGAEGKAGGGVIRDGVRDAEEQSGIPAPAGPLVHRESLLP